MDIDFTRNYFELFGFAEKFEIDLDILSEKYRDFQSAFHPDRFANATDQERRISVQSTALINEAYTTLKSDLKRAHYLLKLIDCDFDADKETSNDAEFLMQQMDLHERVEEIDQATDPLVTLDELSREFKQRREKLISQFSKYYSEKNFVEAKESALKLQFFERLNNQIKKKQEKFEEELL